MLAAHPIASQPLAALPAGGSQHEPPGGSQHEPVIVTPQAGYRWRVQLMVDGLDMTELMTGVADVDREEGGAAVAGFTLLLPAGPVVPTDWLGRAVTLDYRDPSQVVRLSTPCSTAVVSPSTRSSENGMPSRARISWFRARSGPPWRCRSHRASWKKRGRSQ